MIKPREVADKSKPGNLSKAIKMTLEIESEAVKRNTQTFNSNRYKTTGQMEDYDLLKDNARRIKEEAIENLPQLTKQLENSVTKNGGHFYLAKDARDACEHILQICKDHDAGFVVKGKSITSEEIKLNHTLEKGGLTVTETDLAEFILQYSDEQPSHIVGPAIHQSRERISKLFKEKFNPDVPLNTGEQLTRFARGRLRSKFLSADIGITGANFIAADTGSIMLVESEGNIRLSYALPPVHIALAGVEKVLPSIKDFSTFTELLAPSATGQPLTSYTSIITPPLDMPILPFNKRRSEKREFYLVLIDNGRMKMRDDPVFREALYCIRCSACLNSCSNFQSVGGHAFGGETYSGGIGGAWESGTGKLGNAEFSELCTGCSRCVPQCPVRIDIPWLNQVLHQRLNEKEQNLYSYIFKGFLPKDNKEEKSSLQKLFLGNFHHFAKFGVMFPEISNLIQNTGFVRDLMEKNFKISKERKLPSFTDRTLKKQFKQYKRKSKGEFLPDSKVLIFADVYTNYLYPERGMAAVKVFDSLGVNFSLSDVNPEGRAALSQGLINTASKRAQATSNYLESRIDSGYDIIVIEPSVLAMFRRDNINLLKNENQFLKIKEHCFDVFEYLWKLLNDGKFDLNNFFDISKLNGRKKIFYHSHCQQKTIDPFDRTGEILSKIGLNVIKSVTECCGMAGSFGYKKDFYDVSMKAGEDLFTQIKSENKNGNLVILATGISCKDQITDGTGYKVIHPVELLSRLIAE